MPISPSGETMHDREEDEPDDGVEAAADHAAAPIDGIRFVTSLLIDDERERADPGALDPRQPADDRDDEELDRAPSPMSSGADLPDHQA